MKSSLISGYVSYAAFLVALLLWIGVAYFAWSISLAAEEHRASIAGVEQQTAEQASALRLHALARETKEERSFLEEYANADLEEILDSIEALAKDAGVPAEIAQAPQITAKESSPARNVSFSIDAQGTFSQVVHLIALLETMRIPSKLDDIRLERASGGEKGARNVWRVITKIHFLTTAAIPVL